MSRVLDADGPPGRDNWLKRLVLVLRRRWDARVSHRSRSWAKAAAIMQMAKDQRSFTAAWDAAPTELELDSADRWDINGKDRQSHLGRAGP
eukprot:5389697-Pyramimonas_sp.AAC.1